MTSIVRRSKNKIRQLFPNRKIVQNLEKIFQNNKDITSVVLIDIPTNGNLGDQALVYATKKFILQKIDGPINLIEIPNTDINSSLLFLKRKLKENDVVIWNGGGNLGTIYPTAEFSRWSTFKFLKNWRIIMFPQSVFFESHKKNFLKKSVRLYRKKNNLSVYLREQKSFDSFSKKFALDNVSLVPDIVFSLENNLPIKLPNSDKRSGIITLLRNDKEKSAFDSKKLIALLSKVDTVVQSDTYIDDVYVNDKNRDSLLLQKWEEISRHRLVVTDRLHGVIFAYLTKTPALVIPNNNWKIESTYETWLQDVQSIDFLDVNTMSDKIIRSKIELLLKANPEYTNVAKYFDQLSKEVNMIGKV